MGGFEDYCVVFDLRNGLRNIVLYLFYKIGYKIVVFGLRNGLRNGFIKLDTKLLYLV
jgi:hypothetical protein